MLTTVFWFVVGAFVGWNFPQPAWAAKAQAKVTGFFKKLLP